MSAAAQQLPSGLSALPPALAGGGAGGPGGADVAAASGLVQAPSAAGAPLVSCTISSRSGSRRSRLPAPTGLQVLPADVRVMRDFGPQDQPEHLRDLKRGAVQMFSPRSAARLTRTARNAMPQLVSQMCLTYHEANPDGATAKKHLRAWLKALLRAAPGVGYLWILEFQTRGVPHFHVWLTAPYSEALWKRLGAAWNRVAEPLSQEHLWWHTQARVDPRTGKLQRSFMAWDMKGAGYLRKYMSKEAQKCVPDGFGFVGRFWGSTLDLVPEPIELPAEDLPVKVTDLTRTLCKWVEARRKRGASVGRKIAADKGRKYRALKLRATVRAQPTSGWLNNAAPAFWVLVKHLEKVGDKPD